MLKQNMVSPVGDVLKFLSILMLLVFTVISQPTFAAVEGEPEGVIMKDPGSELWRNVRQRQFAESNTQMKSTDANILISISGEAWRQYRMAELIPTAGVAMLLGLLGVVVFRLLRGKMRLPEGLSGRKILRFTFNQRVAHWSTAISFVVLALTGLLLLFGRKLLIPLMGSEGFSYIAVTAKSIHDYLGPVFAVSLIFLFVLYARDNLLSPKVDIEWLKKGGGLIGGHASSDRFNFGEKGWFWIAAIVGTVVVVSGLVLDFPIFGQTRETMEYYHFIHTVAATIVMVVSIGHIYMGTIGVESTFEIMQTGYCDENWAKEHHDLWYEKVKDSAIDGEIFSPTAEGSQKEST